MFTNPEDYHANVLSPIGNSDHCLVSVDTSFQSPVATAPPIHRTVYQYSKADWDGFWDFLNDVPWSYVLSLHPNLTWELMSLYHQRNCSSKPCAAAIAYRSHYFNLHSSTKTDESHQAILEYAEHVRKNISIQKLGTRDSWRTVNSVLNNNKSAIPLLFQGPIVVSSPKDKADVFAQQFAANSILDDNGRSPPDFPLQTPTSTKLPVITPRKVAGIIVNLDINKASAPRVFPSLFRLLRSQWVKYVNRHQPIVTPYAVLPPMRVACSHEQHQCGTLSRIKFFPAVYSLQTFKWSHLSVGWETSKYWRRSVRWQQIKILYLVSLSAPPPLLPSLVLACTLSGIEEPSVSATFH